MIFRFHALLQCHRRSCFRTRKIYMNVFHSFYGIFYNRDKILVIFCEIQKVLTDVTRGVPIVSLRQQRTELLGPPYSEPGVQIDVGF